MSKLLGRPANAQTATIAGMLAQLQKSIQEALASEVRVVTDAVVSSPESIYLTSEEVSDALDYLGIENLVTEPDELFATSAAYAGLGNGLCKSYTEPYTCAYEEPQLRFERVLFVDFSDAALSLTIKGMQSFKRLRTDATLIDTELGYVMDSPMTRRRSCSQK